MFATRNSYMNDTSERLHLRRNASHRFSRPRSVEGASSAGQRPVDTIKPAWRVHSSKVAF
jgi:hypothetical protein